MKKQLIVFAVSLAVTVVLALLPRDNHLPWSFVVASTLLWLSIFALSIVALGTILARLFKWRTAPWNDLLASTVSALAGVVFGFLFF